MRPKASLYLSAKGVQGLAQSWLAEAVPLADHGWKCTANVVWQVVLMAAACVTSLAAVCGRLKSAPCDEAVRKALRACLPKDMAKLEADLQKSLSKGLDRSFFRKSWNIAIDLHLEPYYGEPLKNNKELYRSRSQSGTSTFHAYATACVVEHGRRYTLAITCVSGGEKLEAVLQRLLDRLQTLGVKTRKLLLDRQFFTSSVIALLKTKSLAFIIPIMLRGRKPKSGKNPKKDALPSLRSFKTRRPGRYNFTWTTGKETVAFQVVVSWKQYVYGKTGRRRKKTMLFAVSGVAGSPREIREQYRQRFGIESTYRQFHHAKIYTSTRDPLLRLFFAAVAFVLRNVWVWLHLHLLSENRGTHKELHLERLRFRRLLAWISDLVTNCLGPDLAIEHEVLL